MRRLLLAVSLPMLLIFGGCVHSYEDKLRRDYQSSAQERISRMERNINNLEKRSDQLLGEPKIALLNEIDHVKSSRGQAQAELKELEEREGSTWVQKKPSVDKALSDMDGAYNKALEVLSTH